MNLHVLAIFTDKVVSLHKHITLLWTHSISEQKQSQWK